MVKRMAKQRGLAVSCYSSPANNGSKGVVPVWSECSEPFSEEMLTLWSAGLDVLPTLLAFTRGFSLEFPLCSQRE